MDDLDQIVQIVRIGTVSAVDKEKRMARVMFKDLDITSGWLYVLDTHPHIPDYDPVPQETELETCQVSHTHKLVIKPWLPNVNDAVVCLYLPAFNADGIILGAISS